MSASHGNPYDINHNDRIEWSEAETAIWDYMWLGDITQAQAVDELLRYFTGIPASVNPPTHRPSPQPSPTIRAHPTPVPTATRTPTATPVPTPTPTPTPTLVAPTITYTMGNTSALQVNWSYPEALESLVTGYEVRYSLLGEEYNRTVSRTVSGHGVNGNIPIGTEVTLQVRALSKTASSAWATEILTIPAPTPTPTPTTRPLPTPLPTPMSNAYDNGCWGREKLDPGAPADIRMAAMFRNSASPEREPWEAPQPPKFKYGFILRNVDGEHPGAGDAGGLVVDVDADGRWRVEAILGYVWTWSKPNLLTGTNWQGSRGRRVLLSSGDLAEAGVSFSLEPEALNHLMFSASGHDYRFAVNGQDVPLAIDDEDLEAVNALMGKYYYYDTGQWHGRYAFFRIRDDMIQPTTNIGTYAAPDVSGDGTVGTIIRQLPSAVCKP